MENVEVTKDRTFEQGLEELNNDLGVRYWPGAAGTAPDREELDETPHPAWWHGDEDASSTFLREMGVVL